MAWRVGAGQRGKVGRGKAEELAWPSELQRCRAGAVLGCLKIELALEDGRLLGRCAAVKLGRKKERAERRRRKGKEKERSFLILKRDSNK